MSTKPVSDPNPPLEPDLAPPGTEVWLAVAPGLLGQEIVPVREDDDLDEDVEASQRLLTAVLDFARKG